ncbi:MAG: transcriptional repressor [Gammaproteobacteria bacterium]|nr:transcriptional repressor [Gammaproteobacteria bacterium]
MRPENQQYREQIVERLKAAGVTPTQQRVEIAAILFARDQHMSADQVLAVVNTASPRVSKATVYNTLGLFAEKGLVREVIVDPAKVFYDSNTSNHHHFYHADTGHLTDIDPAAIQIQALPSLPEGTIAEGVDVIIRIRDVD